MATSMAAFTYRALGAQILQARLAQGTALFYCSPLLDEFPGPARGGVPVLFPQFADVGPLQKHGFARNFDWRLLEHASGNGEQWLHLRLDIGAGDVPAWAHAARLELTATARAQQVEFRLSVLNTGTDAFSFTGGLHPYFAVDDLLQAHVAGLQSLAATDRYVPEYERQSESQLQFSDAPFERLYDGCPALVLVSGARRLRLSATGFDQWMVWNPGREGARDLKDLPDEDWQRFICIEPVRVRRPVMLGVGEKFEGSLQVTLEQGA
jgi:glucose-6-phosphate 1-epimerase